MNFIKGTGAILILFAIFASSCNKQSNNVCTYHGSKLDILAANFKGVTELAIDAIVLKDTIIHLQKSLTTLPETFSNSALKTNLTAINGRIENNFSTLNTMANFGTTSKGQIDSLKNDLTHSYLKLALTIIF